MSRTMARDSSRPSCHAVTVSLASLAPHPLDANDATIAILCAAVANTTSKAAIAYVIGSRRFAVEIVFMALSCFGAGAAAWWATFAITAN